jgi:hypothetical protein
MPTRCNIKIEDTESGAERFLYHHHDGYPLCMGPKLEAFIAYIRDRGVKGIDYQPGPDAWADEFVRLSQVNYGAPREPDAIDLTEEEEEEKERRKRRMIRSDFEHTDCIHGDIEYLWRIDVRDSNNPRLTCEKCEPFSDKRKKINYLVAWKAELENSIRYVRTKWSEAYQTEPAHANELQDRITELEEELTTIQKRIKNREGR